jgi:hypothetical protein
VPPVDAVIDVENAVVSVNGKEVLLGKAFVRLSDYRLKITTSDIDNVPKDNGHSKKVHNIA